MINKVHSSVARHPKTIWIWVRVADDFLLKENEKNKIASILHGIPRPGLLMAKSIDPSLVSGTLTCQPRVLTVSQSATDHHQGCSAVSALASSAITYRHRNRTVHPKNSNPFDMKQEGCQPSIDSASDCRSLPRRSTTFQISGSTQNRGKGQLGASGFL